jgi:hypothetical protein
LPAAGRALLELDTGASAPATAAVATTITAMNVVRLERSTCGSSCP